MYAIEKNVPVAPSTAGGIVYPFRDMEPGDSFLVPTEKAKGKHMNNPRRAATQYAKRVGIKLVTRKVEGGLRIWRVA